MIDDNISDVTHNLDTICNGFRFSDLICKEKTNEGYYNYDPIPYPAPNPDYFAALDKPGINRYVMRGCFRSKAVGNEVLLEKYRDLPLWVDSNTKEVCDNYRKLL